MIIRICESEPKLALKISQAGCNGKQLMDLGVTLTITPASCPMPDPPPRFDVCFQPLEAVEKKSIPAIVYPAFELDDEGRIVFYFDNLLWNMPPGRYHGRVDIGGCCDSVTVDIDLCARNIFIEQVAQTSATSCEDLSC